METKRNIEKPDAKLFFLENKVVFQAYDLVETILLTLDTHGHIIGINRKGEEILDSTREDLIGLDWFSNFIPPNNQDKVRQVFDKIIRGEMETVEYFENRIISLKQREYFILWHNSFIKSKHGEILGVLTSGTDITDRKKLELSLIESEHKYWEVINKSLHEICKIDKEGHINFINPTICTKLGYLPEEVIGKHLFSILTEGSKIDAIGMLKEGKKGLEKRLELEFLTKDDNIILTEMNFKPIFTDEGHYDGVIAGIINLTSQKRMENGQNRNKNIETLTSLVREITHDFKNYLTGIIGNLNLISLDSNLSQKSKDYLKITEISVNHAVTLVNQLKTFSDEKSPQIHIKSIEEIIKDVVSATLRGTNIRVQIDIPNSLPKVNIDPQLISQVL